MCGWQLEERGDIDFYETIDRCATLFREAKSKDEQRGVGAADHENVAG